MRRFLAGLALVWSAAALGGVWGNRGITKHFVVRDTRVFAADGRGVAVYDVSQTAVRRVAVAETDSESFDLAFLSDHEIAVATRRGIDRFAVADDGTLTLAATYPDAVASVLASNGRELAGITSTGIAVWDAGNIGIVARYPLTQPAAALAWHGDTLIAAVPGAGVYFFGTGDPQFVAEDAHDIAVTGDALYVAAGVTGIATYDLRSGGPALVSRIDGGDRNFARIAATPQRVFAAELPDTISVYDNSGGALSLIARFKEPAQTIAASSTRAFVSGELFDTFGLSTETGAPIRVFDDATAVGEFRDLAGPVSGAATDGTLAYIVDRPYFRVIDVSTTAAPREIASLFIEGIGDRVRVLGRQAMIYGRGDVQIIDVNNPYAPRLITTYHALGGPPSTAAFGRNVLYEANPYSGFHVVDFTSFGEPRQIGGIKGHYFDLTANGGDVAYVCLQTDVAPVDVANQNNPQLVKMLTIGPVQSQILPANEHHADLLIVQTLSGVRVYNVSDPRNPVEASFTPTTLSGPLAADGDLVYLANPGSLQMLDVSNPARPVMSATAIQPFEPLQLATARGKLVIADRYALRVYGPDTAPPSAAPPSRRRVSH
jgi:hypothetical protein